MIRILGIIRLISRQASNIPQAAMIVSSCTKLFYSLIRTLLEYLIKNIIFFYKIMLFFLKKESTYEKS